jgi:hypothetical protein
MNDRPKRVAARDRLHLRQIKFAFGEDPERPARPAVFVRADGKKVEVRYLGGGTGTVIVADAARLAQIVARDDLTRFEGEPLLMINTHYGVLGVATGPKKAPAQLHILFVACIEDGTIVELAGDDKKQPSWQMLAIRRDGAKRSASS